MKLFVLKNGTLVGPKINSIADADPAEMQTAPIWSVLIEHPGGYLLLDAGCHTDADRQHPMIYRDFSMDPDDHILRRIEALGVAPEDVGTIVLSHLHSDHSGYIELFPNATVYVHADELGQRLAEYERGETAVGVRDMAYWVRHNITWERIAADEPEREIFPRITILNFGAGHSHGMLGLLVDLPDAGKILCAGDAVYNRENVGPPVRLAGNMVDADGFVRAIERISALAGELGAQLWYGHDEEQFASLIKSTEGYYS